ncbi:MAG TPA: hypothetical protein VGA36_04685 [Nitriliruptorales bacterium]
MPGRRDHKRGWPHRYPPLAGGLVAALLAIFVLPSALNVPQSNPTQTLEFAPIPPQDDEPPPPETSNLETLGLGSSSTAPAGDAFGTDGTGGVDLPPPGVPGGAGERPVTKRCVGDPPRQTEDPMSPPCVAHFEGDNGGSTHRGVDADEIRVMIYADPVIYAPGPDEWPRCWDLVDDPPEPDEPRRVANARVLQRFFNDRFQTYARSVAIVVCVSNITSSSEDNAAGQGARSELRIADALDHIKRFDPFAVLTGELTYGFEDAYIQTMVDHGVLSFGARGVREASFFRQAPGFIWAYQPTLDHQTDLFASYVCEKVLPHPVSYSGNGDHGQPRVLGLIKTTEEAETNRRRFAEVARAKIEDCGGVIAAEGTIPNHGTILGNGDEQVAARQEMAQFQQAGVTTVLVMQAYATEHSTAAADINYLPEWLVAGSSFMEDGEAASGHQDQRAWAHARVVTGLTYIPEDRSDDPCYQAFAETAPDHSDSYVVTACETLPTYKDLRQLFTGIQVAGPRLTPGSIDRGFHAIPQRLSGDPRTPACFYLPDDYTCVKDATAEWWDVGNGQTGYANDGCWRMVEAGARYVPGAWPAGNADAQDRPDDPCNNYQGPTFL